MLGRMGLFDGPWEEWRALLAACSMTSSHFFFSGRNSSYLGVCQQRAQEGGPTTQIMNHLTI